MADSNDVGREHVHDPFRLELARRGSSIDSHSGESSRLRATRQRAFTYGPAESPFDRVGQLALQLFGVPIAIVSIEGESRVTFAPGVSVVEPAQLDPALLADPIIAAECGLHFYAAVPLKDRNGDQLGTFCILDRRSRIMQPEQEAVLALLADMVTEHVEFRARASKIISSERRLHLDASQLAQDNDDLYQREHLVAATLQTSMLPKAFPVIDGVDFDAVYIPAGSESVIGGDWYDAYCVSNDTLLLSIGDVAGHGVSAAALTGFFRHSLRAFTLTERSPSTLLKGLDRLLRAEHDEILVTALIVMVDLRARTLRYANAGHPPAFVRCSDGHIIELGGTRLPLGLRFEDEPGDSVVALPSDSLLVLYTDGLTEANRNALEGEERLKDALADPGFGEFCRPAHSLCEQLLPDGNADDDVAIMSVLFND